MKNGRCDGAAVFAGEEVPDCLLKLHPFPKLDALNDEQASCAALQREGGLEFGDVRHSVVETAVSV